MRRYIVSIATPLVFMYLMNSRRLAAAAHDACLLQALRTLRNTCAAGPPAVEVLRDAGLGNLLPRIIVNLAHLWCGLHGGIQQHAREEQPLGMSQQLQPANVTVPAASAESVASSALKGVTLPADSLRLLLAAAAQVGANMAAAGPGGVDLLWASCFPDPLHRLSKVGEDNVLEPLLTALFTSAR